MQPEQLMLLIYLLYQRYLVVSQLYAEEKQLTAFYMYTEEAEGKRRRYSNGLFRTIRKQGFG